MTSMTTRMQGAVLAGMLLGAAGCAGQGQADDDALGQATQADTASASQLTITGDPYPGSTLTASYTFANDDGMSGPAPGFQWYTVSSGIMTAISGATSETYTPTNAQIDDELQVCLPPPPENGGCGAMVCSGTVRVPGIVWYSEVNWEGTATAETVTSGACVEMSDLGLTGATESVVLYGNATETTQILFYTGSNCTGTLYSRTSGANVLHEINLPTVGIGSGTVSYMVSW